MEKTDYMHVVLDDHANLSLQARPSSETSAFTASNISSARDVPTVYCSAPTLEELRCSSNTVEVPLFDDLALAIRTSTASTTSYINASPELGDDAADALQYHLKSTMEVETRNLDGLLTGDDACKQNAAVVLQTHVRRKAAEQRVLEKRGVMTRASTKIQSIFRGLAIRKQMSLTSTAAVCVQSHFRGWLCRRKIIKKLQTASETCEYVPSLEYHVDQDRPERPKRPERQERAMLPPIGLFSAPAVPRKKRRKREVVIVDHHHVHHHHHFHHHHEAVADVPRSELEQQAVDLSLKAGHEHAAVGCDIFPRGERKKRQLPLGATEYYGQPSKMNAASRLHYSPYAFASDLRARRGAPASGFYTRVVKRLFATTLPPIVA